MTLPFDPPAAPEQTAASSNTSAVIVALPKVGGPLDSVSAQIDPTQPLHCTLAFLGTAADLSAEAHEEILALLGQYSTSAPPAATISGSAVLGKDHAVVALIESIGLSDLRTNLANHALISVLLGQADQFPQWIPHITLGYEDTDAEVLDNSIGDWLTFDRLALWWAEERTEIPFETIIQNAAVVDTLAAQEGTEVVLAGDDDFPSVLLDLTSAAAGPEWHFDFSPLSEVMGNFADAAKKIDFTPITKAFTSMVAAPTKFNPLLHPRGKDGKFIEKFSVVKFFDSKGTWRYGKVLNIREKNGESEIEVRPSKLDGTPLDASKLDLVNLKPQQIYSAPKPKAHWPISETAAATKIGPQAGSNPGGLYQITNPETGDVQKYYVKKAKTAKHGHNEALANALYAEAGVNVPDVDYGSDGNIYSEIVPGKMDMAEQMKTKDSPWSKALRRDFAVDAWLGNWDFAGMTWDNVLTDDDTGMPVRIDNGGALLYRAQGSAKGSAFGSHVDELDTFRTGKKAAVFGALSKAEEIDGVERVLAIEPSRIHEMVAQHNLPKSLADTLVARRAYIANYYKMPLPESIPDPAINVPAVDVKDAAKGGKLPRSYSEPMPLLTATLILQPGDTVHLPDGSEVTYATDVNGTHSKTLGYNDIANWSKHYGTDVKVQIKKQSGSLAFEPVHGAQVPPIDLPVIKWRRGDKVVSPHGQTFEVIGSHTSMQTLLLRAEDPESLSESAPFLWSYRQNGGDTATWTTLRWDPPAPVPVTPPTVQAPSDDADDSDLADWEKEILAQSSTPNKPSGEAVPAAQKIKADLVTPLPDGGPPKAPETTSQPGSKSMVLGDGTVADTGDTVVSKVDGKPYTYQKKKGPYAVVTDPGAEDTTKQITKNASSLTQPDKVPVANLTDDAEAPKTADGKVPQLGMIATAKDGHTGEITLISPDGKFTFITDSAGKRKRKSTSQVTILQDSDVSSPQSGGTSVDTVTPEPESVDTSIDPSTFTVMIDAAALEEAHTADYWKAAGYLKPGDQISPDNEHWLTVKSVGAETGIYQVSVGGVQQSADWKPSDGATFFIKPADGPIQDTPPETANLAPEVKAGVAKVVPASEVGLGDVLDTGDGDTVLVSDVTNQDTDYTEYQDPQGSSHLAAGDQVFYGNIYETQGAPLPVDTFFAIAEPGDQMLHDDSAWVVNKNLGGGKIEFTSPSGSTVLIEAALWSDTPGYKLVLYRPKPSVPTFQHGSKIDTFNNTPPTDYLVPPEEVQALIPYVPGTVHGEIDSGNFYVELSDGFHAYDVTTQYWAPEAEPAIGVSFLAADATKPDLGIADLPANFPSGHTVKASDVIYSGFDSSGEVMYFRKVNSGYQRLISNGSTTPWSDSAISLYFPNGGLEKVYDPLHPPTSGIGTSDNSNQPNLPGGYVAPPGSHVVQVNYGGTSQTDFYAKEPGADYYHLVMPDGDLGGNQWTYDDFADGGDAVQQEWDIPEAAPTTPVSTAPDEPPATWNLPEGYTSTGKPLKKVTYNSNDAAKTTYLEQQEDGTYHALLTKSAYNSDGKQFAGLSHAEWDESDIAALVGENGSVETWPPVDTGIEAVTPEGTVIDLPGGYKPPPGSKVMMAQSESSAYIQLPGSDEWTFLNIQGELTQYTATTDMLVNNGWTPVDLDAPAISESVKPGPVGLPADTVPYSPSDMGDLPQSVQDALSTNDYIGVLHYQNAPDAPGTYYLSKPDGSLGLVTFDTENQTYNEVTDQSAAKLSKVVTALEAAKGGIFPDATVTDVTPRSKPAPSFNGYMPIPGDKVVSHKTSSGETLFYVKQQSPLGGKDSWHNIQPDGTLFSGPTPELTIQQFKDTGGDSYAEVYGFSPQGVEEILPSSPGPTTAPVSMPKTINGYTLAEGEVAYDVVLDGSPDGAWVLVKKVDGTYHKVTNSGTVSPNVSIASDAQIEQYASHFGLKISEHEFPGSTEPPKVLPTVAAPTPVTLSGTYYTAPYVLQPGESLVQVPEGNGYFFARLGNGTYRMLLKGTNETHKSTYITHYSDQEFIDHWHTDPVYFDPKTQAIIPPAKPTQVLPDITPKDAVGTTQAGTSYPGSVKPTQDEVLSWGGSLTKDGYIPTSGMKVWGKGPMTGTVLSVSKDKTKAVVITSEGKKSTRLLEAISVDHGASLAALAPSGPVDIPDGMPVAVDTPGEALAHTMSDGKFRAIVHGHPGVRNGQMTLTRMTTPSDKKVARVVFTITPEQRKVLAAKLTQGPAAQQQKGAWDKSYVPSGEVKIGDRIAMRYGSSTSKWKPDTGQDNPTHTVSGVEPNADGSIVKVTLTSDSTGEDVVSNYHTDSGKTVEAFTWNPDKVKPPAKIYGSKLTLSAQSQSEGWKKTNGILSAAKGDRLDVEPGQNVSTSNNAFTGLFNGSNDTGLRQVSADGTIIEITDLDSSVGSHKGVVVVTVPEGGSVEQLNGALGRLGVPYAPMTQDEAKAKVLPILRGLVNFDSHDIDSTKGMSEQQIFTKFGTTIGLPDVGWQDVYVGVDESTGTTAYFWSDRVTNQMKKKGGHNLAYRAATSSSAEAAAATVQYGSANAITKRLTGMVYAPSGKGLGASASSDSSNNAGHGSYLSAGTKSSLPSSNSQASYKTAGMMAYHRPEAIYGRIMDYRAANHDAFGNPGTGANNVANALGSSIKDYWMGGGLPPESLGYLAVSSESVRAAAIKLLHQRGITHINGRPVEDIIITLSQAKNRKPGDLPLYTRPASARPILEIPLNYGLIEGGVTSAGEAVA